MPTLLIWLPSYITKKRYYNLGRFSAVLVGKFWKYKTKWGAQREGGVVAKPAKTWNFFEVLSKMMYKIYDICYIQVCIFLIFSFFLLFSFYFPLCLILRKNFRGLKTSKSKYTADATAFAQFSLDIVQIYYFPLISLMLINWY